MYSVASLFLRNTDPPMNNPGPKYGTDSQSASPEMIFIMPPGLRISPPQGWREEQPRQCFHLRQGKIYGLFQMQGEMVINYCGPKVTGGTIARRDFLPSIDIQWRARYICKGPYVKYQECELRGVRLNVLVQFKHSGKGLSD